jgi:putative flippase GtrA
VEIFQIIRFGIVGSLGMVIDFLVTWFFKEKVRLHKLVANGLGFSFAVIFNFLLNRSWTFQVVAGNEQTQLLRFILVSLIGLGLNTLIVYLLTEKKINFYVSKLIAIVIVFVWNYTANRYFTFAG